MFQGEKRKILGNSMKKAGRLAVSGAKHSSRQFLAILLLNFTLAASPWAYSKRVTFEDNWGDAGFTLVQQDASGVEVVFSIQSLRISDMELDGQRMQNVTISGVMLPNRAGAPNLPGTGRFIALPQGATAELRIIETRMEVLHGLNIAPAFILPKDGDGSPLEYPIDADVYNRDAYFPSAPVILSSPTTMRGVDVVILRVTPFQYNPISRDLIVYKDIRLRIDFLGGTGHFGEDRLRSLWWEPILSQNLLNYASLPKVNFNRFRQTDDGNFEYVIIIPDDPAFSAWADTLKRWRSEQGIITGVTTLSEIGGNDTTLIKNYVGEAYNSWTIPPVAVLLLSDYQDSGDQYGITSPLYFDFVADNIYADINGNQLPDLNIARITARDEEDLMETITKMLDYEREPPTDPDFYLHPVTAGGWQTECWFILCCETIWGYFHNVLGKDPGREYAIYSGTPGSNWSTNPNTWMIVDYFGPEGLGYIPETPDYLTDWGGSARRLNQDINNGCFLIQHRDHGSVTGWSEPNYHNNDLRDLENETYPYVFSMNCSTGKYNYPTTCFAEAFHRSEYGAIGVMAASGTVYSFVNDTFTWGVYDAMWPDFDPVYGGTDENRNWDLRPGFANAGGKYYLAASSWPINPQCSHLTYQLFHHHGDAFLTLYSEIPQELTVSHRSTVPPGATSFAVSANEGSFIGLSMNGEVVGTAEGTGAYTSIPVNPLPADGVLRVTVTKANYYRYISDVTIAGKDGWDGWSGWSSSSDSTAIATAEGKVVSEPILGIRPNPFNSATVLSFRLQDASWVKLEAFNVAGRAVGARHAVPLPLMTGWLEAGQHEVMFDASGLASGVYLYRLETSGSGATPTIKVGKMVLMK